MRIRGAMHLGLLLGLGLATSSLANDPPPSAHGQPKLEAPPVRWEIDANQAVWWTWMEDTRSVVVNVGPLLYGKDGGSENWVRRWTFMVSMPGTTEPLTCVQGFFVPGDAEPLVAKGANFHIKLQPVTGLTWGDVRLPTDMTGTVETPPAG